MDKSIRLRECPAGTFQPGDKVRLLHTPYTEEAMQPGKAATVEAFHQDLAYQVYVILDERPHWGPIPLACKEVELVERAKQEVPEPMEEAA